MLIGNSRRESVICPLLLVVVLCGYQIYQFLKLVYDLFKPTEFRPLYSYYLIYNLVFISKYLWKFNCKPQHRYLVPCVHIILYLEIVGRISVYENEKMFCTLCVKFPDLTTRSIKKRSIKNNNHKPAKM
jgi:hypothetical protein